MPNVPIRFPADTDALEASLVERSIRHHLPSGLENVSLSR